MKKTLLITLLLIVGCSKEPINYETTLVDGDGVYYTEDTVKPYSGEVFSLYELGGRKKSETTLKDGKLDGLWTSWYWNQKKEKEGTYKDGRLDGEWTYYTLTGNGKYSITYTISDYDSIKFTDNLETYYADFIVPNIYEAHILGLPTVPRDYSNANGTYLLVPDGYRKFPIAFRTFKDGKLDGLTTGWHENGQKELEATYKDGKPDGLSTYWHENGQKSLEGTYKDGERDGLVTQWYENGQKSSEITYKDGRKISVKGWNEDGSVKN